MTQEIQLTEGTQKTASEPEASKMSVVEELAKDGIFFSSVEELKNPPVMEPGAVIIRAEDVAFKIVQTHRKIELKSTPSDNWGEAFQQLIMETVSFKKFLETLKNKLAKFDKLLPSLEQKKQKTLQIKASFFRIIDDHYGKLGALKLALSHESYQAFLAYYRVTIRPLMCQSPLNNRICSKPFGFIGDHLMMKYYYNDEFIGESVLDILTHRYSMELPIAKANYNRKSALLRYIYKTARQNEPPRKITSFGCGPAEEIISYLQETPENPQIFFNCLDIEPRALEHIEDSVKEFAPNSISRVDLYALDVLQIVRNPENFPQFFEQDLVYSSGLLDYFKQSTAKKMVKLMATMLKCGGTLVVINVTQGHGGETYMEALGEWYLHTRTVQEMEALAKDIPDIEYCVYADSENGANLYLEVKKLK